MTEHRTADRRPAAAAAVLIMLLLLPVPYVLSIGPMNWLISNDYLDSERVGWLYDPLLRLADRSDTAREVLAWYLSIFGYV